MITGLWYWFLHLFGKHTWFYTHKADRSTRYCPICHQTQKLIVVVGDEHPPKNIDAIWVSIFDLPGNGE
jgi:hypothetical protein